MTISYQDSFSRLMFRWRGSLWKAVFRDLIIFYLAYYFIMLFQWRVLNEQEKEYFTGWINWCEYGTRYIPLSFLVGFFVAVVVARWWDQFNWISWPDRLMMTTSICLPGPENLNIRKTIARWSSLVAAIAWSDISVRTLKRFPTTAHFVRSNLMTEDEYQLYESTKGPHGKWFLPVIWISNLIKTCHKQGKIDSIQLSMLIEQVFAYRVGFAQLFVYDWVKIPLVYTQVVAIATYGYFGICLIARQPKLDQKSMEKEVSILFPIFTTFQIFFYLGWLKVGQFLMNPFGEDDDDFELNYILDRNAYISQMIVVDVADQMPNIDNDYMKIILPHTKASFKIQISQDVIPKSNLSEFRFSEEEMQLITPNDILNSKLHSVNSVKKNIFFRAIDMATKRTMRVNSDSQGQKSIEIDEKIEFE